MANGITMATDSRGRKSGVAYVQFTSQEAADEALQRDREIIGSRWEASLTLEFTWMFLWWPRSALFYFLSCLLLLVLFLISADTSRCFPAEEMRFTRPGGRERVHFRLSPGLSQWTGGVVRNFNWNWKNVQILHLKYEYKHKTNKKKHSRSGYNETFVMWLCKISYLTLFWKEAQRLRCLI